MGQMNVREVQAVDAKDSEVSSLVSAMQQLNPGATQVTNIDVDIDNGAPRSTSPSLRPANMPATHKTSTSSAAWKKYQRAGTTPFKSAGGAVAATIETASGRKDTAKDRKFRATYGRGYQLGPSLAPWTGLSPCRDVLWGVHEKRRRKTRLSQHAISRSESQKMQLDGEVLKPSLLPTIGESQPDEMWLDDPRKRHMLQPTVLDSEPDEMQLDP